jgi:hypothetical protein
VAASTDEVIAVPISEPGLTASSASPWLRRLAVALAVCAVLEAVGILLLGARDHPNFQLDLHFVTIGFFGTMVSFPVVGALIVVRRPRTRVAWVMIGMGVTFGAGVLLGAYSAVFVTPTGESQAPFAFPAMLLSTLLFVPPLGFGTTILLLLYPTDTLLSPRWRIVAAISLLGSVIWNVGVAFRPGPIDNPALVNVQNPWGAPSDLLPLFDAAPAVSNLLILAGIALATGSLFVRYRRGDSVVRAQIRWFGLIAAAVVVSFVLANVPPTGELFFGLGVTAIACLPIAIGVAISRYRLYDIDLIINRALVYGSLTAILAGVFTAGVGLGQRLFVAFTGQSSDAALVLATLVIATLYAPLRKRLEAIVDKRFKYETRRFGSYGEKVMSVLAVIDPARAAESLAKEAVSELDATGAAVIDAGGAVLASAGAWPTPDGVPTTRVALADAGPIRAILVGPGRSGRAHAAADLAALEEVGRLTTAAVRTA